MKLEQARQFYYRFSGKASDICRQLGLAGIAIVWIFKGDPISAGKISLPTNLHLASIFIVISLACDFLQYVVASALWGIFARYQERHNRRDDEFLAPKQINWPAIVLFCCKVAAMIIAYIYIVLFLGISVQGDT